MAVNFCPVNACRPHIRNLSAVSFQMCLVSAVSVAISERERDCWRRKCSRNKNTKAHSAVNNYGLRRRKCYAVKVSLNRPICGLTHPHDAKLEKELLYLWQCKIWCAIDFFFFFKRKISGNFGIVASSNVSLIVCLILRDLLSFFLWIKKETNCREVILRNF